MHSQYYHESFKKKKKKKKKIKLLQREKKKVTVNFRTVCKFDLPGYQKNQLHFRGPD